MSVPVSRVPVSRLVCPRFPRPRFPPCLSPFPARFPSSPFPVPVSPSSDNRRLSLFQVASHRFMRHQDRRDASMTDHCESFPDLESRTPAIALAARSLVRTADPTGTGSSGDSIHNSRQAKPVQDRPETNSADSRIRQIGRLPAAGRAGLQP